MVRKARTGKLHSVDPAPSVLCSPSLTVHVQDAIQQWTNNPLFSPYYRQVGYLLANSPAAPEKAKRTLAQSLASISEHPAWAGKIKPIITRQDIRDVAPAFDGPMRWTGYFNSLAGYARAADALHATYAACCDLGVVFKLGDGVKSLVWNGDKCTGALTSTGVRYDADVVVLTLGASLAKLLPMVGPRVTAKAWSVVHVQLTPYEAGRLRGIPVTYARDLGYFFEPDTRTNLLKLSPSGAGITNYNHGSVSLPPQDSCYIPPHDEEAARRLLRETLPGIAERPFAHKKLCWVADTRDSDYIIDFVPGKQGLVIASGDSGHGFKMFPIVGSWIKALIEEGEQRESRWQWKADPEPEGEYDVSWRVGKVFDLGELGNTIFQDPGSKVR